MGFKRFKTFVYDDTLWKVRTFPPNDFNVVYIGDIVDGRIIGEIPAGVASLERAFEGLTELVVAPKIPDNVSNMDHTFDGCVNLEAPPVLPEILQYMNYCFSGCKKLKEVPVIPNRVNEMSHAFYKCTSLESTGIIPDSVNLMYKAFGKCTSLVKCERLPDRYCFSSRCFEDCINLEEIPTISTLLYSTENYNGRVIYDTMFIGCEKLMEIHGVSSSQELCKKVRVTTDRSLFDVGCSNAMLEHGDKILTPNTLKDLYRVINVCIPRHYPGVAYVIANGTIHNLKSKEEEPYNGDVDQDTLYVVIDNKSNKGNIWEDEYVKKFVDRLNEYFDHEIFKVIRYNEYTVRLDIDRDCIYEKAQKSKSFLK